MSKTTPRCFTENGEYPTHLCLSREECLITRSQVKGFKCLRETPCETLFQFEGPPMEEKVVQNDIAVYDGKTVYFVKKGSKVRLLRFQAFMVAVYVTIGARISKDSVIAGLLSRKGNLRKYKSEVEGKVILIISDPLSKISKYVILVDEEGVVKAFECRKESSYQTG